ncbi:F-box protein [Phanerochaete sordida]|uniref:F-box protein n=1 Tax=Phanerochaete sordida TaxID=48140 RepID=A0A9P3G951_9APHY|nr:F-box protein [Phanerochaete sordida]
MHRLIPTQHALSLHLITIAEPFVDRLDSNHTANDIPSPIEEMAKLRALLDSPRPLVLGDQHLRQVAEYARSALQHFARVAPFVGVNGSQRWLDTRLPSELLDAIVGHIAAPKDLLALALVCKRMSTIVLLHRLDYRIIRAKVSSLPLWSHLTFYRYLARNVRVLEILDERGDKRKAVPRGVPASKTAPEPTHDTPVEYERPFISALACLTTLHTFIWSYNQPPVSVEQIWQVLLKCQTLLSIDMKDNRLFASPSEDSDGSGESVAVLPDLKTVSLMSTTQPTDVSKAPSLTRVVGMLRMLSDCQRLENLTVGYSEYNDEHYESPNADDLLLLVRLSQLRSLSLINLRCSSQTGLNAAADFLAAHANLQVLHLDLSFGADIAIPLPPDVLPRLRELQSGCRFASALFHCPCSANGGRPLDTLKGMVLNGGRWSNEFLDGLESVGGSMRRIELAGWSDKKSVQRLATCVPNLTWLDVGKRFGRRSSSTDEKLNSWIDLLAQLVQLEAFHGVRLFHEVHTKDRKGAVSQSDRSHHIENGTNASILMWRCVKLRRLDHWKKNSGKVIALVRDGDSKYKVVEDVGRW